MAAGKIASHTDPLEQPDLVNRLVPGHLARDTVETMMPLRRAGGRDCRRRHGLTDRAQPPADASRMAFAVAVAS
ncbi:hypothetical protein [Streptomyces fungicidicus]